MTYICFALDFPERALVRRAHFEVQKPPMGAGGKIFPLTVTLKTLIFRYCRIYVFTARDLNVWLLGFRNEYNLLMRKNRG